MKLEDLLKVTCCSVRIVRHIRGFNDIYIGSHIMERSIEDIYKHNKIVYAHSYCEVLAISSYYNGIETILTVII